MKAITTHQAASARLDDLTAAIVEEYGGRPVRRTGFHE